MQRYFLVNTGPSFTIQAAITNTQICLSISSDLKISFAVNNNKELHTFSSLSRLQTRSVRSDVLIYSEALPLAANLSFELRNISMLVKLQRLSGLRNTSNLTKPQLLLDTLRPTMPKQDLSTEKKAQSEISSLVNTTVRMRFPVNLALILSFTIKNKVESRAFSSTFSHKGNQSHLFSMQYASLLLFRKGSQPHLSLHKKRKVRNNIWFYASNCTLPNSTYKSSYGSSIFNRKDNTT